MGLKIIEELTFFVGPIPIEYSGQICLVSFQPHFSPPLFTHILPQKADVYMPSMCSLAF